MNSLQIQPFNWEEYLNVCLELQKQHYLKSLNLEEATIRCVLSRSYYSVFNITESYLKTTIYKGKPLYKELYKATQEALLENLNDLAKSMKREEFKYIRQILFELKTFRVNADYNEIFKNKNKYPQPVTSNMADRSIQLAQQVIKILNGLNIK